MLTPYFEISPEGDYIALRSRGRVTATSKHERGMIRGFSFRSRSRLMKKIAQTKKHHLPCFVTLTYGDSFPANYKEYKYDLHKFFQALKYYYPLFGVIWKLEFQQRGAAHFHLLLYGCDLERVTQLIPDLWHKIAGRGQYDHLLWHQGLLSGTVPCVQAIRSWRGVQSYASKYMVKLDDENNNVGRFWGVRGDIPISPLISMKIDIRAALDFRRAFRRKMNFRFRRFGFWAFGANVDWLLYVDMLCDYHKQNEVLISTIRPKQTSLYEEFTSIDFHEPPPVRYDLSQSPPKDDIYFFSS